MGYIKLGFTCEVFNFDEWHTYFQLKEPSDIQRSVRLVLGNRTKYRITHGTEVVLPIDETKLNLDGFATQTELNELMQYLTNDSLREYALQKSRAMYYRACGDIKMALALEKKCESLYKRLEPEYRW